MSGTTASGRIERARLRLVLERPFLGVLASHLPLRASEHCRRFATDGTALHFRPAAALAASDAELGFVIAHLVLHCALGHPWRGAGREPARWNLACDLVVNGLLAADGMALPAGAACDPRLAGRSAESIYAELAAAPWRSEFHAADPASRRGGEDDADLSGDLLPAVRADSAPRAMADRLSRDDSGRVESHVAEPGVTVDEWEDRVRASALLAAQAGRLGASWRRFLPASVPARLSWRALLERFVAPLGARDYSYSRASRREGEALLPGRSGEALDLVVALDTSGSIEAADLAAFCAECARLRTAFQVPVTLLACDDRIADGAPWRFEPWEEIVLPARASGGGMTRFTPVFDWVERHSPRPGALVYFTDAVGEFPPAAPDYPVLWVVQGRAPVPWGTRVAFE